MTIALAIQIKETVTLRALAVLLSCVLPIQIMGRAAIAGTLVLAFFCFLFLPNKLTYLKHALEAVQGSIGLMLLIAALFWVPNLFQSSDPVRSLEAGSRMFIFIGLAVLFWAVLVENTSLHGLLCRTFIIASGVAIIVALIAELAVPELYWFMHFKGWRDVPVGTSLKSFAALAVFMIPALLWIGFRLRGWWVLFSVASAFGFLALVGLTYNRATIAGLIVMIVFGAGLVAWASRSRLIRISLPLGALAVLIGVLVWLSMTRQRPGFDGDWYLPLWLVDYQRQSIWKFAAEIVQQNFWFGMGMNTINFAPGAEAVIPNTIHKLKMIPSHPHNWILEVMAETGVFGLLSLSGAIAVSIFHMIRKFLLNGDNAYLIAACMSVGYWVSGLFNFSFWSAWWQMSFVLIIALCLSQQSGPAPLNTKKIVD
jgi:O-antigen ligase